MGNLGSEKQILTTEELEALEGREYTMSEMVEEERREIELDDGYKAMLEEEQAEDTWQSLFKRIQDDCKRLDLNTTDASIAWDEGLHRILR